MYTLNIVYIEHCIDMGVGSGAQEDVALWIFIHGTDIVEKGLIVSIFGLFSVAPSSLEEAFFGLFCYFRSFFRCPHPKIFLTSPLCIDAINFFFSFFFFCNFQTKYDFD